VPVDKNLLRVCQTPPPSLTWVWALKFPEPSWFTCYLHVIYALFMHYLCAMFLSFHHIFYIRFYYSIYCRNKIWKRKESSKIAEFESEWRINGESGPDRGKCAESQRLSSGLRGNKKKKNHTVTNRLVRRLVRKSSSRGLLQYDFFLQQPVAHLCSYRQRHMHDIARHRHKKQQLFHTVPPSDCRQASTLNLSTTSLLRLSAAAWCKSLGQRDEG